MRSDGRWSALSPRVELRPAAVHRGARLFLPLPRPAQFAARHGTRRRRRELRAHQERKESRRSGSVLHPQPSASLHNVTDDCGCSVCAASELSASPSLAQLGRAARCGRGSATRPATAAGSRVASTCSTTAIRPCRIGSSRSSSSAQRVHLAIEECFKADMVQMDGSLKHTHFRIFDTIQNFF